MIADKENSQMMFPGCAAAWTSQENAQKSLEGAGDRAD